MEREAENKLAETCKRLNVGQLVGPVRKASYRGGKHFQREEEARRIKALDKELKQPEVPRRSAATATARGVLLLQFASIRMRIKAAATGKCGLADPTKWNETRFKAAWAGNEEGSRRLEEARGGSGGESKRVFE